MRKWILFSLMLLCSMGLEAQTTLRGRVFDGATPGETLIGASVKVPGTSIGTVTDLDGNFSFQLPAGKTIIQVSMVGYKTQVVNVKGKTAIEVTLEEDRQLMEEVVVVGYGTMRKRDLSGAVSQIKGDDLRAGGSTDIAHGLQGKVAGVDVRQSDGSPGAGVSITVRGANSFTTSSQPLYIVDGIPFGTDPNGTPTSDANGGNNQQTSPLQMINPNDIEKIEVLKDASATAIYGSRGANGVVIITTRKGQTGKPKIEVGMKWTMQKIGKKVKTLDPYTYALYQNEANQNSLHYENGTQRNPYRGEWEYPYTGGSFVYTQGRYNPRPEDFLTPGLRTDEYGNRDTVEGADWQDEIYRTGWQQEYNASVSGGSDQGWYAFSGSYTKQDGTVRNTGYERYGLSINIARHITPWLEIGTSSHFTTATTDFQRTNSENTGIIRSALIFPPTVREESDATDWLAANPVNYVNGATDQLKQMSWFSSSYAEAKLTPWLKFRQNLGLGYNDGHRNTYYNRLCQEGKSPVNGKAGKAANTWKSLTSESLLARVNYTLLDKYLFTASIRSDGSSAFQENNKWATFLSGAVAWRGVWRDGQSGHRCLPHTGRLQLTIDYYYKRTRDLLQNVTIPSSSGFSQQLVNSGNVTNEGLELTLMADVLKNGPLKCSLSGNMAFNRNRIGGLSGDQYATALWSKADQVFLQRNGYPIGTLFGYVEDGYYDNVAEVRANKAYASLTDAEAMRYVGEIKYRDMNGDGQASSFKFQLSTFNFQCTVL